MAALSRTITYALNAPEIQTLCDSDSRLSLVIKHYGELMYTLHSDPFAHMIESIVGQMLSSKAADAITARLYTRCGGVLTPDALSRLEIVDFKGIGASKQKAVYIARTTKFLKDNPGFFDTLSNLPDEEIILKLTKLRGVGMWSAKMYLIFVLDRQNVLPFEDGAFQQSSCLYMPIGAAHHVCTCFILCTATINRMLRKSFLTFLMVKVPPRRRYPYRSYRFRFRLERARRTQNNCY